MSGKACLVRTAEVTSHKHGVSALELQRVPGLGSYRTTRAELQELRRAMLRPTGVGRIRMREVAEASAPSLPGILREVVELGPRRKRAAARVTPTGRAHGIRTRLQSCRIPSRRAVAAACPSDRCCFSSVGGPEPSTGRSVPATALATAGLAPTRPLHASRGCMRPWPPRA